MYTGAMTQQHIGDTMLTTDNGIRQRQVTIRTGTVQQAGSSSQYTLNQKLLTLLDGAV